MPPKRDMANILSYTLSADTVPLREPLGLATISGAHAALKRKPQKENVCLDFPALVRTNPHVGACSVGLTVTAVTKFPNVTGARFTPRSSSYRPDR